MIYPDQVAVVIPTRGDVDLTPVVSPFTGMEIIVWDNSVEIDLGVYGRYAAIPRTHKRVIITVDDDAVLSPKSVGRLLAYYRPGVVVCNVPKRFREQYTDSGLVGFGAIFDAELPQNAFDLFTARGGTTGPWFRRTCDLVFTMLTPMAMVDLPHTDQSYASDDTRMWRQPGHTRERKKMRAFCRGIRDTE